MRTPSRSPRLIRQKSIYLLRCVCEAPDKDYDININISTNINISAKSH
jgi:hypothetical protein